MGKTFINNMHNMINAQKESYSVEKLFLQDLLNTVEKEQSKRQPSRSYKPSSLICLRQMYYQIIGAEQEQERGNARLIGMGESGTDRHDRLQKAIMKLAKCNEDYEWIDVEQYVIENNIPHLKIVSKNGNETKCFHEVLNMSFMCDGILKIKGVYYILEIKTESSFKFKGREAIAEDHRTQASCYSTAFKIDNVIFLYENRDSLEWLTFLLHVTEHMKQTLVVDKINQCDNYVSKLTPPPRADSKKTCQYCKYVKLCRKDN